MNRPGERAAHAAVLLAAGGSARLGRPKQLLTRAGETLLQRTARLLAETAPQRLLVVLGAERDTMTAALAGARTDALAELDCECIDNPDWRDGLSSSLRAAARALAGHAGPVLLCGCDQPALEATHLAALLSGAAISASGCAATLHAGTPGIPAVVPGRWFAEAEGVQGDAGFGARLRALPRETLFLLDAPELAFDVDTDADLRAARDRGLLDADG